jgi:hypothetical protein
MLRRAMLPFWIVLAGWVPLLPAQTATRTEEASKTQWQDVRTLVLEGQGWSQDQLKAPFDRLPAKAEGVVPAPVWSLSRNSTGLAVRFVTDAPSIQARWTVTKENLAMPHMPATGVSGLDLYTRVDGQWRWLGVGQPRQSPTNTATLVSDLPPGSREYLLYLPLYNGVTSVEIGVPEGSTLAKAPERPESQRKPVVFYGTSITQGGCASRPGMVRSSTWASRATGGWSRRWRS